MKLLGFAIQHEVENMSVTQLLICQNFVNLPYNYNYMAGNSRCHILQEYNYRLTFLSRSTALPNVQATTMNNSKMVDGRLDINACNRLSGFL